MNAVYARRNAEGLPLTLSMEQISSIAREAEFCLTPVCEYPATGNVVSVQEIQAFLSFEGVEVVKSMVSGSIDGVAAGSYMVVANKYDDEKNYVDNQWRYEYDGEKWTCRLTYDYQWEVWANECHARAWPLLPGIRGIVADALDADPESNAFHKLFDEAVEQQHV